MIEVLEHKRVVTKKEHRCFGCDRKFPKGSNMSAHTEVGDGGICRTYWCDDCTRVWNKYMGYDDEINSGDLIANYPEEYGLPKGDRR